MRFASPRTVAVRFSPATVVTFITCLLLPAFAIAQGGSVDSTGTGGRHSIQGRIIFPSGKRAEVRLKVRLESSGAGDLTALSDLNGYFSFQSLLPGNYTVVVDGGDDYESVREQVFIESATVSTRRVTATLPISRPFTVQVYLQPKNHANAKPGVIDASLATVPKPALDSYNKGIELAAKGDHAKAIEALKEAVALYPAFATALNELGVQYLNQRDPSKAADTLRSAVNLVPTQFAPRLNYGIALLNLMKFSDAEQQLREAIKLGANASTAHMYLGITLVSLKQYEEAEKELELSVSLAGGKLAPSHYYLGGIYWRMREYKRAADELQKYLDLEPKAADADKVRATIKDLRART